MFNITEISHLQLQNIQHLELQKGLKHLRKKLQSRNKRKELLKKSFQFNFAEQDQIDVISYSGLEEKNSYIQMDDKFVRTLFVSGYPYIASTGWLNMLINFNYNIDISYHIEQVDPIVALPKLNRKITELEATKRAMMKNGRIVGSEITDPLDSAITLKDNIQRGKEKLFQISIYMAVTADSLSELNQVTKILETIMSSRLFYIKNSMFQQLEGLQSVLPRGENILSQKRNLDSSSAALTFPFVSSELVQEAGILYGINKSNNSDVFGVFSKFIIID